MLHWFDICMSQSLCLLWGICTLIYLFKDVHTDIAQAQRTLHMVSTETLGRRCPHIHIMDNRQPCAFSLTMSNFCWCFNSPVLPVWFIFPPPPQIFLFSGVLRSRKDTVARRRCPGLLWEIQWVPANRLCTVVSNLSSTSWWRDL